MALYMLYSSASAFSKTCSFGSPTDGEATMHEPRQAYLAVANGKAKLACMLNFAKRPGSSSNCKYNASRLQDFGVALDAGLRRFRLWKASLFLALGLGLSALLVEG